MVRLKDDISVGQFYMPSAFQFQDGSIKSEQVPRSTVGHLTFQFQDGSIKSI